MNTLDKILYLVPDAKCSVWECGLAEYQGEGVPVELDGCLVSWNPTNTVGCPSQKDLDKIVIQEAEIDLKLNPTSSFFEPPKDSKADLLIQLAELTAKINALPSE